MAADKSRCDPRTEVQAAGLKAASLGQIHLGGVVGLPFLSIARRWRACCLAMQGPGVMLGPFISSAQEARDLIFEIWLSACKIRLRSMLPVGPLQRPVKAESPAVCCRSRRPK